MRKGFIYKKLKKKKKINNNHPHNTKTSPPAASGPPLPPPLSVATAQSDRSSRTSATPRTIDTADSRLDMLAYNSQRLNIYKVCLLGRPGEGNDLVEKAHERYPKLVVPFAMIDVDQTEPAPIDDLADRGFRGLKIINPRRNYDDPTYFPLYPRAARPNQLL